MKDKFFIFGKRLIKHELISGSFYMFLGLITSSFLSFLLNLFLVRNLTSSDYGTYSSLLSVLALTTISAQALAPIIVKFAADYFAKDKISEASQLYAKMFKIMIVFSLILMGFFIIFSSPIKNFLKLDSVWYVILAGLTVSLSYAAVVNGAYLQSLLKFSFISLSTAIGGTVRIIIGVSLIILGLKVFGALWAIFLALLIPFLIGFYPLRFLFRKAKFPKIKMPVKEIFIYAIPTSITVFSLISLTSTDVILVKHFFSAHDAGLYGGLSLIGKVIFYFTGTIPAVMFPLLIKRHAKGQSFNRLFYLALILVTFPGFAITSFYFLFPIFSVKFFLGGGDYLRIAQYIGLFGILITVFSMLNLCVNFFLSMNKTKIAIPIAIGAILQIVLINLMHSSFIEIIYINLFICSGLLAVLLIYYFLRYEDLKFLKDLVASMNNPQS